MVRIKLSELMGREKMNQKTLAKLTGIRPATISNMYYEDTKRIEIDQINSLCKVFHCTVGELLEYVPDESRKGLEAENASSPFSMFRAALSVFPIFPVEASVLDGFRHVGGLDVAAAVQIRDGARHLQHPIVAPGRESQPLEGRPQQPLRLARQRQ